MTGLCDDVDVNNCSESIENEVLMYNDILQGDFIDSYKNNTLKTTMALKYVTQHCSGSTGSKYVLLIDSDYSLNVHNLLKYVTVMNRDTGVYGGKVWTNAAPVRWPRDKHYRSLKDYRFQVFPPFVAAGAVLLTQDVAQSFYILSAYTKYIPFDDVFYGIIAYKLGIHPIAMDAVLPSSVDIPEKDSKLHHILIGSHRFGKYDEVKYIYDTTGK